MPITTTKWPLLPHGRIKHVILRRYLLAWIPIVGSRNDRLVYIDAFAGPGRYSHGEEGSPVIAVKAVRDHSLFRTPLPGREVVFIFIEEGPERFTSLKAELAALEPLPAWIKVEPMMGTFAAHVDKLLSELEAKKLKLAPTLAFIDPFGFDVPMDLVRRIGRHPSCECLISFMHRDVIRFFNKPELEATFDKLFEAPAWRAIKNMAGPKERREKISDLYRTQLMQHAGFKYVRAFEMAGRRAPIYSLFFCTNSPKGLSEMKKAMWKGDPIGGRSFSDRWEGQKTLFGAEADLLQLRMLLQKRFRAAGWVPVETIERYVLVETPYSEEMHLRQKTLKPMEREKLIEVKRKPGKRAGFTPGTVVRFV